MRRRQDQWLRRRGRNGGVVDVVILSERLGRVTAEELRLEGAGAVVRSAPLWTLHDIRRHGSRAVVIIAGAVEPLGAAALHALTECRAIVRRGVGYDNVDLVAATDLGIVVANVPDASVEEVSDHALSLLLSLERRVNALDGPSMPGLGPTIRQRSTPSGPARAAFRRSPSGSLASGASDRPRPARRLAFTDGSWPRTRSDNPMSPGARAWSSVAR